MEKAVNSCNDLKELEKLRVSIFGKKGYFAGQFAKMKSVPNEEKKDFAQKLNTNKEHFLNLLSDKKMKLESEAIAYEMKKDGVDVTLFSSTSEAGALHPVMDTMDKIIEYFVGMNFSIEEGPLVEDDFHNFEALNLPKYHPARDMQDTFYFEDSMLLRTHTSPVQIRTMLKEKPPIRMICPGAVF